MRPRARPRDVQVIAAGLRLEAAASARARGAVRRDPVAELRFAADEPPLRRFGVVPDVVPLAFDEHAHGFVPCGNGFGGSTRPGSAACRSRGSPAQPPESRLPAAATQVQVANRSCYCLARIRDVRNSCGGALRDPRWARFGIRARAAALLLALCCGTPAADAAEEIHLTIASSHTT